MTKETSPSLRFAWLAELARRLERPILVFDLESTTFRGRANFGITEIACLVFTPKGHALSMGTLINPERTIDAKVVELNGITQADVRSAENWGVRYSKFFATQAVDMWVCGYNSDTFDVPAVKDMGTRYGHPVVDFPYSFDVRKLHLILSGAKSRKGKLNEVAAMYNVHPDGKLHRATADTFLTADLLNAIIQTHGIEAVLEQILPKEEAAFDKLTAAAIARYVQKAKGPVTVEALASAFAKEPSQVTFELGKAMDERLLDPRVFESQSAQQWLDDALPEVDTDLLSGGRLRPLHDALLQQSPPPGALDYVQLRIALLRAGLSWNSLKPAV